MSAKSFPSIINMTLTPPKEPGGKVGIHLNQAMHLAAAMSRRGASKICFKLPAAYCTEFLPEAYNNSMLDINLATGEAKIYPKARQLECVLDAVNQIVDWFAEGGLVLSVDE
jgi:hypothetical protein